MIGFLVLIAGFLGIDADTRVALYVAPIWFAILAALGTASRDDPIRCRRSKPASAGALSCPSGGTMTISFAAIDDARRRLAGSVAGYALYSLAIAVEDGGRRASC